MLRAPVAGIASPLRRLAVRRSQSRQIGGFLVGWLGAIFVTRKILAIFVGNRLHAVLSPPRFVCRSGWKYLCIFLAYWKEILLHVLWDVEHSCTV